MRRVRSAIARAGISPTTADGSISAFAPRRSSERSSLAIPLLPGRPVVIAMGAVVLDGLAQPFLERRARIPADDRADLGDVRPIVARLERLPLAGERREGE